MEYVTPKEDEYSVFISTGTKYLSISLGRSDDRRSYFMTSLIVKHNVTHGTVFKYLTEIDDDILKYYRGNYPKESIIETIEMLLLLER